jgi:hypothetical protein
VKNKRERKTYTLKIVNSKYVYEKNIEERKIPNSFHPEFNVEIDVISLLDNIIKSVKTVFASVLNTRYTEKTF